MTDAAALAAALTGFLVAGGLIWTKIVRPLARLIRLVVHASDALDQLTPYMTAVPSTLPVLIEIAGEFRPNGGASMFDRTVRIEQTLGEVAILARENADRLDRIDCRLAAHLYDDPDCDDEEED